MRGHVYGTARWGAGGMLKICDESESPSPNEGRVYEIG